MPDPPTAEEGAARRAAGGTGTAAQRPLRRRVTARGLRRMLQDGGELALLDVREAGQFGESHLLQAVPLAYSRLELDVGGLAPRRSVRIVLCGGADDTLAELAAGRLEALGYTDVAVLTGGTQSWAAEGFPLVAGVNVPSKAFGEWVEHAYHTPRISVQELSRLRARGESLVILDGRPYAEYRRMSIPGGICCPNGELAYRFASMVTNPATRVVVNCAGRTRSIIGAQTLINFGVPNPVAALENGTQGWCLADYPLERGASQRYPDRIDPDGLPELRAAAQRLTNRFAVATVTADTVGKWLTDPDRTTYVLDVRTHEEFTAGSLPGAVHAPGGQLLQATDQWIGVRNSRIVLVDDEGVRAPVVATWLKQMGREVSVLAGGIRSGLTVPARPAPALAAVDSISAPDLRQAIDRRGCTVLDLRASMAFRRAHIPGSRWAIRPRIASAARDAARIVLVAEEEGVARLAATDLRDAGHQGARILAGGWAAWVQAGYETAASPDVPADAACIDYLFFVHDRHAGNKEAMRQYLAWETGLLGQLAGEGLEFRLDPF